jgi:TRAP-type C4-dicarboxylate transport system substrate-binding protein
MPCFIRRAIIAATLFLLLFPLTSSAKTVLRMNHQFPATASGSKIDAWFAEEVSKATNGEVEIKIFWAGAMGGPKENLALLSSGALDMAAMSAGYFPAELPLHAAPNSLPIAMDNVRQASAIMKALVEQVPGFKREADGHGIKNLFFHILNPYYLFSREPVTSLAGLSGMKIRTWGVDLPVLMKAARATPVTVFLPELYENLQRGVIDACPFSLDLAVTYRINEVAPHVTEVVIWEGPSWGVWINQKAWDNLSPENQRHILDAAERARLRELAQAATDEKRARQELMQQGVSFHNFPPADLDRWQKAAPDFLDRWIQRMADIGLEQDARQAAELWRRMRRDIR